MRERSRTWAPVPRPLAGRKLERELRPERVGALARRIAEGVRDPEFERLLSRIDASPFLDGGDLQLFVDGNLAVAAMRDAIDSAQSEVLLEAYIFRDDATGQGFAESLGAAAERGVKVRVLADGIGSQATSPAFWQALEKRGVEVRLFNPHWVQVLRLPIRDHRKILVLDRKVTFTGGMNIGEEYGVFGRRRIGLLRRRRRGSARLAAGTSPQPPRQDLPQPWRDTHARATGTAAEAMAVVFGEGWARSGGTPLDLAPIDVRPPKGCRLLVLDNFPGRAQAESVSALVAIVASARRRAWLTSAYFAPNGLALNALRHAARRGVDVRLLLPGETDVPLVRHAGHGTFHRLLEGGVRIHEYQRTVLHAKSMVVDDHAVVVGSTNLDFRSFLWNAECNWIVLSDDLGSAMSAAFEEDLRHAREITLDEWRRRSPLHALGDFAANLLSPLL